MSSNLTPTDGQPIGLSAPRGPAPFRVVSSICVYLGKQYPPGQAASVGLTGIATYLVYSLAAGNYHLGGHGVAAAALVVILFLQYRLIDDTSTCLNPELGGGAAIPARPQYLALGLVATLPIEFLLEPHTDALLVALSALCLMGVGSIGLAAGKQWAWLRFAARVVFVEFVPVVIFSYVYFAWKAAEGRSLPAATVVAAIGGLIAGFQFWKWSRDLGDEPSERIYFVSWPKVRGVLVLLAFLAAAFNGLLYHQVSLSVLYLAYVLVVCAYFVSLVAPRTGQSNDSKPWWAGLAFPVLLQAGLYVQLLALAF
jgi:hypothetical protein